MMDPSSKVREKSQGNDDLIKIDKVDQMNAIHKIYASKVFWNKNLESEFIYKSNIISQDNKLKWWCSYNYYDKFHI